MYRPSNLLTLATLLALAACASDPARRCAGDELRERATLDRLVAETRETLSRGYVMVEEERAFGVNVCLGSHRSNVGISLCADPTAARHPQAIDTAAETRKLKALLARREALDRRIADLTASCQAPGT